MGFKLIFIREKNTENRTCSLTFYKAKFTWKIHIDFRAEIKAHDPTAYFSIPIAYSCVPLQSPLA